MGIVLYIVSLLLSALAYVPGLIMQLVKAKSWKAIDRYFAELAIGRDAYYNSVCGELFNAFFIQKGGYLFGKRKETISSALGKNKERGTLTWLGEWMDQLLSSLDRNHTLKNIDRTV